MIAAHALRLRGCNPLWSANAALALTLCAALALTDFRLDYWSLRVPLASAGGLAILARFYTVTRPDPRLAAGTNALALLVIFTCLTAPLSYISAAAGRPLVDARLYAWDCALGFDWRALIAFVEARPALGAVLGLAYDTLMPQMAIATIALAFTGRTRALDRMIAAMILSGVVAVLISAWAPAVGNYVFLHLPAHDYAAIRPSAGFIHMADFEGLRSGFVRTLAVDSLQGIITFPSYHASLGLILAWAFWQVPALRWPGLAWEATMIVATPVHGAHYLVDVLAGSAIAGAAIALSAMLPRRDRTAAGRPAGQRVLVPAAGLRG